MKNRFLTFIILTNFFLITSCSSSKKFALLQDVTQNSETKAEFEAILQPDDILMIFVSAEKAIIAQPYNLVNLTIAQNSAIEGVQQQVLSYQIDQDGNIEMPGIGKIVVAGKTRNQLIEHIKTQLIGKINNPLITVKILNFKISVQGEVNNPGIFPISSERITLLEALSMAGDVTIYGKRDNILVIREENGIKSFQKVDITKGDFINSPYYYLSQNDVIYVEPNKTRVNSSVIGPNITVGISALSLIITIVALTTR